MRPCYTRLAMKLTLALPSLVWPQALDEAATDILAPGLTRLISASDCETLALSAEEWLARHCGVPHERDWPIAPILAQAELSNTTPAHWLFADPVHLQLGHDDVILQETLLALPENQATAMLDTLNRHFAEDGWAFQRGKSGRWYLGLNGPAAITTAPPRLALRRPVRHYLPRGEDAGRFLRASTEIQMLLHEHPMNHQREERGEPTVNSLWFWGGGAARPRAQAKSLLLCADGDMVRALAHGAGAQIAGLPPDAHGLPDSSAEVVLWLDALDPPHAEGNFATWCSKLQALEQQWLAPLCARADRGDFELRVLVCSQDAVGFLDYRPRSWLARFFNSREDVRHALTRVRHRLDATASGTPA